MTVGSTYNWGVQGVEEYVLKKETRWPKNPQRAHFRITVHRRGHQREVVDFSPEPWATNRRDLCGWAFPGRRQCAMCFADVVSAVDLETGEVLSRVGLWKSVLHHREDSPPWYVCLADQHLMTLCLVMFVRREVGTFKKAMRPMVNAALCEVGYEPLDDEGFKSIVQAVRDGYNGQMTLADQVALLTEQEKAACRRCLSAMLPQKDMDLSLLL